VWREGAVLAEPEDKIANVPEPNLVDRHRADRGQRLQPELAPEHQFRDG
jgi:hypothetical protein